MERHNYPKLNLSTPKGYKRTERERERGSDSPISISTFARAICLFFFIVVSFALVNLNGGISKASPSHGSGVLFELIRIYAHKLEIAIGM